MSYNHECNFLEGKGIPYRYVYHLLHGTKKSEKTLDKHLENQYFHDANLIGYGWDSSDQEIKEINEMEFHLGSLPHEILDLRAMVDFCCIWRYDYPERIHQICRAIGGSGDTVGRCHYQIGTDKRDELTAYARALKKWLGKDGNGKEISLKESKMEEEIKLKVFNMLGKREELKELLVDRTLLGLVSRNIDCSFFGSDKELKPVNIYPCHALNLPEDLRSRMRVLESEIKKRLGGKTYDFLCEVGGAEPPCHFKFIRRLEILIGSIGCLKWRGYLPPKDSKVSGRRYLTKKYLAVLHSYCTNGELESGWNDDASYYELRKELFSALGERSTFKRWLVASLWKNIQNQTRYQAFTMKRWVEFVQIIRRQINSIYDEA
ncbi:MAG: hypothetical protein AMJ42_03570 [Deltaproteobacteria bacterium DG_8]|nr:MAG: hypothetical protein AMJ42_03570 [Deltaproteobacteria bacterium DG_8]